VTGRVLPITAIVPGGNLSSEVPTEAHVIISYVQARPLLDARQEGAQAAWTSLDLGLTKTRVELEAAGIKLPGGETLAWQAIELAAASESACFVLRDGELRKVQAFSGLTRRAYSLYPTRSAPTLLVSGIPMHRIKGTDPQADTLAKIKAVGPVHGRVLDTATGLGYTAIEAAKTAAMVVTVELDPAVLEIARLNPWSQGLFSNPKIHQIIGDAFDVVQGIRDGSFDIVIHDPPYLALAGELYSLEFYRQLHRVLKPGGRLFHYVGDPSSKTGSSATRGVLRRLADANFRHAVRRPGAFGVVAYR
jgi:hypothetical protein